MAWPLKDWDLKRLKAHLQQNPVADWLAPRDGGKRKHKGIDFYSNLGEPVCAVFAGRVDFIGIFYKGLPGVWICHNERTNEQIGYCELKKVIVQQGQWVEEGDQIGEVGQPVPTYPPMLHLALWRNGEYLNPMQILETLDKKSEEHVLKLFHHGNKTTLMLDGKPIPISSLEFVLKFKEG